MRKEDLSRKSLENFARAFGHCAVGLIKAPGHEVNDRAYVWRIVDFA